MGRYGYWEKFDHEWPDFEMSGQYIFVYEKKILHIWNSGNDSLYIQS